MKRAAGKAKKANRLGPTLLLALPFFVAAVPEVVDSTRTVDVTVSRSTISPERIELLVGERVRLHVISIDGMHGLQVNGLGLKAAIPANGRTVTLELTPKEVGRFAIDCPESCGEGHRPVQALLIVTPRH